MSGTHKALRRSPGPAVLVHPALEPDPAAIAAAAGLVRSSTWSWAGTSCPARADKAGLLSAWARAFPKARLVLAESPASEGGRLSRIPGLEDAAGAELAGRFSGFEEGFFSGTGAARRWPGKARTPQTGWRRPGWVPARPRRKRGTTGASLRNRELAAMVLPEIALRPRPGRAFSGAGSSNPPRKPCPASRLGKAPSPGPSPWSISPALPGKPDTGPLILTRVRNQKILGHERSRPPEPYRTSTIIFSPSSTLEKGQAVEFKLDRMRELADLLGNPQAGCPCLHVAGSKGKGSVSTMLCLQPGSLRKKNRVSTRRPTSWISGRGSRARASSSRTPPSLRPCLSWLPSWRARVPKASVEGKDCHLFRAGHPPGLPGVPQGGLRGRRVRDRAGRTPRLHEHSLPGSRRHHRDRTGAHRVPGNDHPGHRGREGGHHQAGKARVHERRAIRRPWRSSGGRRRRAAAPSRSWRKRYPWARSG